MGGGSSGLGTAGVPQDRVNVTFEAGMLSRAVKALPLEVQGKCIRHERPWGNWSRQLELPKKPDSANITAQSLWSHRMRAVGVLDRRRSRYRRYVPPHAAPRRSGAARRHRDPVRRHSGGVRGSRG